MDKPRRRSLLPENQSNDRLPLQHNAETLEETLSILDEVKHPLKQQTDKIIDLNVSLKD